MSKDNFERKHKLALALEGVLPALRSSRLETFDYMNFKDDADFETWLAETKEWAAEVTDTRNANTSKPNVINADVPFDKSKVSSNVNAFIDSRKADYQDPLGGKTGSEPFQVKQPSSAPAGPLGGREV